METVLIGVTAGVAVGAAVGVAVDVAVGVEVGVAVAVAFSSKIVNSDNEHTSTQKVFAIGSHAAPVIAIGSHAAPVVGMGPGSWLHRPVRPSLFFVMSTTFSLMFVPSIVPSSGASSGHAKQIVMGTLKVRPSGARVTANRAVPSPRFVVSSKPVPSPESVIENVVSSSSAPGGTSIVTLPSGVVTVPPPGSTDSLSDRSVSQVSVASLGHTSQTSPPS